MKKRILISGASIAGPALAYWLERYGFETTVVERAPAIRLGGYAVDVRGAGLAVLQRMGLLDEARRAATDTRATSFVDRQGRTTATFDRGFGVIDEGDVEIMRGDLAQLLHRATCDAVEYRFGDSIANLEHHDQGVRVTFERGETRDFDLVLGADGLHSRVRRLTFGDEAQFLRHLGSYMAIFSAPNFLELDRLQLMHNLPGKVVSLKPVRGNGELKVTVFFSSPPISYDHRDVEQQRRLTAQAFAGDGWVVPRLVEEMLRAPDFYFDSTSQVHIEGWSRGRVALAGDACGCPSPLTGQGTSLALVGAYVLAGEIAGAGTHVAAFARYQETMRGFVERNQKKAASVAQGFAPRSSLGVWWRDFNFKLLPYLPWGQWVFKMMTREIAEAASAIQLPEYGSGFSAAVGGRPGPGLSPSISA